MNTQLETVTVGYQRWMMCASYEIIISQNWYTVPTALSNNKKWDIGVSGKAINNFLCFQKINDQVCNVAMKTCMYLCPAIM